MSEALYPKMFSIRLDDALHERIHAQAAILGTNGRAHARALLDAASRFDMIALDKIALDLIEQDKEVKEPA